MSSCDYLFTNTKGAEGSIGTLVWSMHVERSESRDSRLVPNGSNMDGHFTSVRWCNLCSMIYVKHSSVEAMIR